MNPRLEVLQSISYELYFIPSTLSNVAIELHTQPTHNGKEVENKVESSIRLQANKQVCRMKKKTPKESPDQFLHGDTELGAIQATRVARKQHLCERIHHEKR